MMGKAAKQGTTGQYQKVEDYIFGRTRYKGKDQEMLDKHQGKCGGEQGVFQLEKQRKSDDYKKMSGIHWRRKTIAGDHCQQGYRQTGQNC